MLLDHIALVSSAVFRLYLTLLQTNFLRYVTAHQLYLSANGNAAACRRHQSKPPLPIQYHRLVSIVCKQSLSILLIGTCHGRCRSTVRPSPSSRPSLPHQRHCNSMDEDHGISASHGNSTPSKLRSFAKLKGSIRTVDHGSCDFDSSSSREDFDLTSARSDSLASAAAGVAQLPPSSVPIPATSDSPGGTTLHHRRHHSKSNDYNAGNYPQQYVRSTGHSALPQSSGYAAPFHNGGLQHGAKKSSSKSSSTLKRMLQLTLLLFLTAYFCFLRRSRDWYKTSTSGGIHGGEAAVKRGEGYHQQERLNELKNKRDARANAKQGNAGRSAGGGGWDADDESGFQQTNQRREVAADHSKSHPERPSYKSHNPLQPDKDVTKQSSFTQFAFSPSLHSKATSYRPPPSTPAYQRAADWATPHLQTAISSRSRRRSDRKSRTTPSNNASQWNSEGVILEGVVKSHLHSGALIPLWYELDHLATETIEALHERWRPEENDATTIKDDPTTIDTQFTLCGAHAKEASHHYPDNYQQQQRPLGPQSRVLISGILSPLGLHLALALHRQCNVTTFLGLDTEIPNDPLARLEQQERLAVLMEELENVKQLQVPFLGLEGKRGRKQPRHEREAKAREERLVELGSLGGSDNYNTANADGSSLDYSIPYQKYGIPLSPGTDPSGAGPLEILLEYRPTHVVHLAGTQSDSLLNSKNANDPSRTPAYLDKEDEDEAILKESISSRPHLYELRMGVTGMEQLLSAVVAQTVLPPRYGRDDGSAPSSSKQMSESDLNKMRRPHVVYASSYDAHYFGDTASRINDKSMSRGPSGDMSASFEDGSESLGIPMSTLSHQRPPRGLHGVSRLIDEVLSAAYNALHGVSSIGLRFDAIYGPRGFGVPSTSVPIYNINRIRKGGVSSDVDLAETAVRRLYRKWRNVVKEAEGNEEESRGDSFVRKDVDLIEEAGWLHAAHDARDFVYVEDAVGAIIAAMQYRAVGNSPTTFNIGSGEMSTLSSLSEEVHNLSSNDNDVDEKTLAKSVIDVEQSSAARSASLDSNEYLRWSASTSLKDGAAKLLSWHLDRALPFFPPAPSTEISQPIDGEDVLSRRGIKACSSRDESNTCLREEHTSYPCSSECSTKTCTPSVFDEVIPLSQELTDGCSTVLYTASLGYNVKTLHLQTTYSDGQEQKEWNEPTICTLAFVPSESTLVKDIIGKVPPSSLAKMGLAEDSVYQLKLKKLSGHLVHQGWILIFVNGAAEPLSSEDIHVPKLSPRRLFHPSVEKAMYVDENFASTPYPEDAQFLASEMSRGRLKKRTVMGPDERGKKIKYKLPEEPQRTAVLMVAPMRHIPDAEGHRMPLKEVSKGLMKEVGANLDETEPKEVKVQREFYERARSLINSMDLRSLDHVSRHRIEIKDFIRSRWVVHDLMREEGHQLRCEWYREHVRWNTHLDQLSFAYVMAKRELTRKVITEQPLQTDAEEVTLLQMIIDIKSDAKEWHPIFSGEGTKLPVHHSQIAPEAIPQNLQDQPDNEVNENEVPDTAKDDEASTFYVRIMSDERMLEARKKWMKERNQRRQMVAQFKKKNAQR